MTYPTDDGGNPQVDFAWGNLPMQPNDQRQIATLNANDSHKIALEQWANYPAFSEDVANTLLFQEGIPGMFFPDFYSFCGGDFTTRESALAQFAELGVDPEVLKDFTFSGGTGPYDYAGGTPNNDGIVFYLYLDPEYVLFTFDDGTPYYAKYANNSVAFGASYPGELTPVNGNIYDLAFIVVQTEDPTKHTYDWWN